MRAMITFTVPGGKRLIAMAIARMPEVVHARETGRILLKSGSTVSAIAEELIETPMRISGRISPRGLLVGRTESNSPRHVLIEGPAWRALDQHELRQVVRLLRDTDVYIVGANAIDAYGGAALMGGGRMGGTTGEIIAGITVEGPTVIVAAGLEKLIPGRIDGAIRAAGRRKVDLSMGMAVGLMPIYGRVVTEVDAIKVLAPVECEVIGKGGVEGAEGGITLVVSGEPSDVKRIFNLAMDLREATISGAADTIPECEQASRRCQEHLACVYRAPKLLTRVESRESRN